VTERPVDHNEITLQDAAEIDANQIIKELNMFELKTKFNAFDENISKINDSLYKERISTLDEFKAEVKKELVSVNSNY
jgi:hypothetical protein